MTQINTYKVDLAGIDGNGDFPCPRCRTNISPDDCTEEVYSIMGTRVSKQGLEELIIRCKKCRSQLHIVGFSVFS